MKKRDLFLDKIQIDETFSMQIDLETEGILKIYENDVEIDNFSLTKRIYTLFKVIQEYTNSDKKLIDKGKNTTLYGKEIHIKDQIYMQAKYKHEFLIIEFFLKEENSEERLLYLTKMNYTTQKLFHMMLIPKKVLDDPKYQLLYPKEFKDLIDILSIIKI